MSNETKTSKPSNNNKSKFSAIIASTAIAGVLVGGLGTHFTIDSSDNAIKKGEIIATVGDEKITQKDLYKLMLSNYGSASTDNLVTDSIIAQEAKKKNLTASKDEIDKELNTLAAQYGGITALENNLKSAGRSMTDMRKDVKSYVLMKKLIEPRIKITDAQIEAYFNKNKDSYAQKEKVQASHILVKTKVEADKVYKLATKKGADFGALAKKYSTDQGSATQGGQLGYFSKGQMVADFEKEAFAQKVGTISKPVKSDYGYHIIKVTGHINAKAAKLSDVKGTVKQALVEQGMSTEYAKWLAEMKKQYKVKNSLEVKPSNTTGTQSSTGAQSSTGTQSSTSANGSNTDTSTSGQGVTGSVGQ